MKNTIFYLALLTAIILFLTSVSSVTATEKDVNVLFSHDIYSNFLLYNINDEKEIAQTESLVSVKTFIDSKMAANYFQQLMPA